MDHARRRGVATLLVIVSGVGACTRGPSATTAPLPSPAEPVTSKDQIVRRLQGHLVKSWKDGAGPTFPVTGRIMNRACPQTISRGAPLPPRGVPAFTGHVRVKGVAAPLDVRFWLTSIPQARRMVAGARDAADNCAGHHPDGGGGDGSAQQSDNTVSPYARRGWTGVSSLTEGRIGRDTDPPDELSPFAREITVAARGGLVAEVIWEIEGDGGGKPEADWYERGKAATGSVLAAVGGDPARPAPTGPPGAHP